MTSIRLIDPRIQVNDISSNVFVVKEGCRSAFTTLPPQSINTGTLVYQLNNVGPNSGRSRQIMMHVVGSTTYTLTGASTFTADAVGAGQLGFKTGPFNRNCQSTQHTLGGATESYLTNQIIDIITKFKANSESLNFFDNFQPDCTSDYTGSTLNNISPIVPYGSSIQGSGNFKPRNVGITSVVITGFGALGAVLTIEYDFYEPLITPFSSVSPEYTPSLWAIDGESIQIQLANNCTDMFAISPGVFTGGAAATYNVLTTFTKVDMQLEYITSKNLALPSTSVYKFPKFQVFQTPVGTLAPGAAAQYTIQVNSQTLPSNLVAFCRQSESLRKSTVPDVYATLSSLTVQLDNGSQILTGATIRDLYNISKRGGSNQDFATFSQQNLSAVGAVGNFYGAGSVCFLSPATDLSTWEEAGVTNGSAGKYTLNFNATFVNNTGTPMTGMTAYVYTINEAVLVRQGRTYTTSLVSLSPELVAASMARPATTLDEIEYNEMTHVNLFLSGGAFRHKFFKHLKNAAKLAYDNKDKILEYGKKGLAAYNAYKESKGGDMQMYYE